MYCYLCKHPIKEEEPHSVHADFAYHKHCFERHNIVKRKLRTIDLSSLTDNEKDTFKALVLNNEEA